MKIFHFTLLVVVSAFLAGCDEGTRGGPGATNNTTDNSTVTDATTTDMPGGTTTTTTDINPAPVTTDPTPLTPGAPGTVTTTTAPAGDSEDTFTLDLPNLSTSLKQGETAIVSVGIAREEKFDDNVTLEFQNLPKGVTIEPAKPMIKVGDKEAKVTVKAAADAALGDHAIKVIGHPAAGKDATNELNISVTKP